MTVTSGRNNLGRTQNRVYKDWRQATLKQQNLDFDHAKQVFAGPTFTFEDDRKDYGEQRWVTLGLLQATVVVIVHTETDAEIRIISMCKADKDEQHLFFSHL